MGRMKEMLFDLDEQAETYRAAAKDYRLAECAERLDEMISRIAVAKENQIDFLIDDLRTEIMYLNDVIRRH